MISYGKDLNAEQLKVVTSADGPCLVLAGAGSGKTRTITYRVAYLLEQRVKPENILLVTFTNKAAKEMIERVRLLTPNPSLAERGEQFILPWSGTFHHIGYRILKRYATLLGYKNNFSVLDSEDSLDLIKLCLKDEGIDRKERRFPSPAVLQAIISYSRNSETTVEDILDLKYQHFLPVSETIVKISEDYQKRKLEANAMDFDDLLVNWYLLLVKNLQVKNKYAEQFQYILVDEYQDTNKIQALIIDLLASKHKNILVVGDDAQSIYSFRAADIQNILAFEKRYQNAKIFKLETNYRSTPDILNLANNIISNNLNQYEKNLQSLQEKFIKPELHAFANQQEEAEFIAGRIEELQGEGVGSNKPPHQFKQNWCGGKIAVLFRAAYHSQALEMELVKRGIDYDYRGGVRFFERAHIKDVLVYLRIINNIEDAVAWRRVLNMQIGIGSVMAERIIDVIARTLSEQSESKWTKQSQESREIAAPLADASGLAMTEIGAQLSAKAQIGWADFLQIYQKLSRFSFTRKSRILDSATAESGNYIEDRNPGDLIAEILDSKYIEYLENEYPDYRERIQDIEQLATFASKAEDLNTFLAEATLQESFRQVDNETNPTPLSPHKGGDKIVLSTIHQAKGLEWEAVFVIGMSAGQFPNDRAMREEGGLEEERRLFYVAVTRAKKYLYLTYSFTGGWGDVLSSPSMFIEEIDVDLVENNSRSGKSVFQDDEVEYVDEDSERNLETGKLGNLRRGGFLRSIDEL